MNTFHTNEAILQSILKWYKLNHEEKKDHIRNLTLQERKELIKFTHILKKDNEWKKIIKEHKKIMSFKNIMVLDLETTGFSHSSRIVQMSFSIHDEDGKQHEIYDSVIKQEEGILIPPETTKVHGITNEIARTQGKEFSDAINIFENRIKTVSKLIGHNINFDINVIKNELTRINRLDCLEYFSQLIPHCTMKTTRNILKLTNIKGIIKNPKLSELYQYLFNEEMKNQHNSKYDVINTSRCYFELMKREKEINKIMNKMNKII